MQSWSEREIEADPLAMGQLSSDDPGSYEADYRAIMWERQMVELERRLLDLPTMQQPSPSDDHGPSIVVRRQRELERWLAELERRLLEQERRLAGIYLQEYLESTEYSAYEKVVKMLAEYVSNWYTPDTSELKQYPQDVSADERFELLKKKYALGYTALHVAAERGHVEVMRCLLQLVEPENQIQLLDIPNEYNQTSLDVAEGEEIVQLIRQYRESAEREIAEGKSPRDLLSYVLNDLSLEERQSLMSDERLRSKTFLVNWPHDGNLSGVKMAQAVFYCVDDYDTVQCTFCHGSVHNWEVEDNPMTKHIKLFPSCPFVKGVELETKEYKNENKNEKNTDKRDVTTETSGELLEDSGDLKDAEEQNGMRSNEKESSLPATSVNELVDGERLDVLLEPADEIKGITEDMDISFQDTDVESKHSAVVDNVQQDSVLVQKLRWKIAELEAELAGYQSDVGRGSHELRDTVEGQIVSLTGVEVSSTTSDRTHNKDIAGTHKSLVNEDGDELEHNSSSHSVEDGDELEHNSSFHSEDGDGPEHNSSSHSAEDGDEPEHNSSSHSAEDGDEPEHNSSSHSVEDGDELEHNSSSHSVEDGDGPEHNSSSHSAEDGDEPEHNSSFLNSEMSDEIKGITKDIDIPFQDTVVESKHSAVVDNVQPDTVLVQELELAKFKIAELEAELAGYQSDAGRGSHELRDTVEGQIGPLTGVEVSSTTSDRTHNKDIAGTHKSLANDGDEPQNKSSSYSAEDETCRIFSSSADEESLHLMNITKNIKKDIDMTANEITQSKGIVNTENIELSLSDSTLFKPDLEPALSDVEVKVNENPEDKEMRDQISELTQKLGLAKLRIAELEEQLAAIHNILIYGRPSNAAAATQQDVSGTQQSDLSVTIDAVEEVGAEMDIRVGRGSDSSLE